MTPEETIRAFAGAMNDRDIEALMSYYDDDSALVVKLGTHLKGRDAIRKALESVFPLEPNVQIHRVDAIESTDVAMCLVESTFKGTTPKGKAIERPQRSVDVLRRQPDGRWLFAIDNAPGTTVFDEA